MDKRWQGTPGRTIKEVGLGFPGPSGMSWRHTLLSILLTMTLEWALLICPLACCYSKLESLLEMQTTRPHPGILNQKVHFSNIPRKLIYTLKIEEHWSRLLQWPLQDLPVLGLILTLPSQESNHPEIHIWLSHSPSLKTTKPLLLTVVSPNSVTRYVQLLWSPYLSRITHLSHYRPSTSHSNSLILASPQTFLHSHTLLVLE